MACMVEITCQVCGKVSQEVMQPGGQYERKCSTCAQVEAIRKRVAHLGGLKALSVEQRLEKIEEWIYDYKPQYVPHPTF